ncbi:MAG: PspC domain-containing protein [Acutalibacteraceae bacterium]
MEHKKLHKSATDKKICGVCGGLAEYLNIDPTIIRLIWALTVVFAGTGVLAYLIAALIMPEDVTPIV